MEVRIEIAGFGAERPSAFGGTDDTVLTLPDKAVVADAMAAVGLAGVPGLAVMLNDRPVEERNRADAPLRGGDILAVLYALEGG